MKAKTMPDDTKLPRKRLLEILKVLRDFLDEQRMAIAYLRFDGEATRRERDFWKKEAGGK